VGCAGCSSESEVRRPANTSAARYGERMTDDTQPRNPLSRRAPLGGSIGVAVVAAAPVVALVLFLLFGFLAEGWAWAWVFFLLIPVAGWVVYGLGPRNGQG
jgi:MFS family permease